ncbi:hypothetical protein HanPI659440_Chr17g0665661 [Helianthus annuus]|nr:hypothetical protein HanPI659440_Chr17g0665661 [Helianthus annuus]
MLEICLRAYFGPFLHICNSLRFYILVQPLSDSYACYRFMLKYDYFALFAIKRDF